MNRTKTRETDGNVGVEHPLEESSLRHQREEILVIGAYETPEEAIFQRDSIFVCPVYFLHHWIKLLGPGAAWLVVSLKQRANVGVRSYPDDLARELGVSESTIRRWLKSDHMRWFTGLKDPMYRDTGLRIASSPVTPRHMAGLCSLLGEYLPTNGNGNNLECAEKAVKAIIDMGRVHGLVEEASHTSRWQVHKPMFVFQVVWKLFDLPPYDTLPQDRRYNLFNLCRSLETRIVLNGVYMSGSNYFLMNWVRHLGPAMSWLVVYLRSYGMNCRVPPGRHVHDDVLGREARVIEVQAKDVEAVTGRSLATLKKLLKGEYARQFARLEGTKDGKLVFTVRTGEILAPGIVPQKAVERLGDEEAWIPLPGLGIGEEG